MFSLEQHVWISVKFFLFLMSFFAYCSVALLFSCYPVFIYRMNIQIANLILVSRQINYGTQIICWCLFSYRLYK